MECDLKCRFETRTSKDGKSSYEVVVIWLTPNAEKLIFLDPAEKELIRLTHSPKETYNPLEDYNA